MGLQARGLLYIPVMEAFQFRNIDIVVVFQVRVSEIGPILNFDQWGDSGDCCLRTLPESVITLNTVTQVANEE